jgi:hypothetical protein
MLDAGYWMLDAGCWLKKLLRVKKTVAGCRILDTGCWMLDAGYWMLVEEAVAG